MNKPVFGECPVCGGPTVHVWRHNVYSLTFGTSEAVPGDPEWVADRCQCCPWVKVLQDCAWTRAVAPRKITPTFTEELL